MARSAICGRCMGYGEVTVAQSSTLEAGGEALCICCGADCGDYPLASCVRSDDVAVDELDLTGPTETQIEAIDSSAAGDPEQGEQPSEGDTNVNRTVDNGVPPCQQVLPTYNPRIEQFQRRWDDKLTKKSDLNRIVRVGANAIFEPSTPTAPPPIFKYPTSARVEGGKLKDVVGPEAEGESTTGAETPPKIRQWLPPLHSQRESLVKATKRDAKDTEGKGERPGSRRKWMGAGGAETPAKKVQRREVSAKVAKPAKTLHAGRLVTPRRSRDAGALPATGRGKLPQINARKATRRGEISSSKRPEVDAEDSMWDVGESEDEE